MEKTQMDWSNDMDGGSAAADLGNANIIMDIHGDPLNAKLMIFSDGNHHMALRRAVAAFKKKTAPLFEICFLTTPPGPLTGMTQGKTLHLGNMQILLSPHVFISPPHVLDKMKTKGVIRSHTPFVKSRGCVLLVAKGNPEKIIDVRDLARPGIRLFISNPEKETDSHNTYAKTLAALSQDPSFLSRLSMVKGEAVHHREAVEALCRGHAHAAVLFYHLARHYADTFPDRFELIPLGGTKEDPAPLPGNIITSTHAAVVGTGGEFGQAFFDFLFSRRVRQIYTDCGLVPL